MGLRYAVQAQGLTYTVVNDVQITYQAVITGSLTDEASGTPLLVEALITPDLPGLGVNLTDGALFAVTAYVKRVFPQLATTAYTVHLGIAASGYRPTSVTVPIPAGSTLPIALPAISMRPLPVRLQGRVVKASDRSAIAGATISSAANAVLLARSPLYFDHASGVAVNAVTFTPTGPARSLATTVTGGSSSLALNNTAGLLASQILRIGSGPLTEMAVIQSLGPNPAQVNLLTPVNSSYPAAAPVQQVNAAGPIGSAALARSSNTGDGLMILAAPLVATGIQIADGAQTEYHLLNAISDGSGYYHANGMAGVVWLNLQAAAGGFTNADATWLLDYNNPVNVVDFRLTP